MTFQEALQQEVEEQKTKTKIRRLSNMAIVKVGVVEAEFDSNPQLPGTPSATKAILKRLRGEAEYDSDPQLPGMPSATQAILKRLRADTLGKSHSKNPIKEGKQSDEHDVRVRGEANEPTTKFERGIARIRRDEMQAISRIIKPCIVTSTSVSVRNKNVDVCSSEEGPGGFLKKLP